MGRGALFRRASRKHSCLATTTLKMPKTIQFVLIAAISSCVFAKPLCALLQKHHGSSKDVAAAAAASSTTAGSSSSSSDEAFAEIQKIFAEEVQREKLRVLLREVVEEALISILREDRLGFVEDYAHSKQHRSKLKRRSLADANDDEDADGIDAIAADERRRRFTLLRQQQQQKPASVVEAVEFYENEATDDAEALNTRVVDGDEQHKQPTQKASSKARRKRRQRVHLHKGHQQPQPAQHRATTTTTALKVGGDDPTSATFGATTPKLAPTCTVRTTKVVEQKGFCVRLRGAHSACQSDDYLDWANDECLQYQHPT